MFLRFRSIRESPVVAYGQSSCFPPFCSPIFKNSFIVFQCSFQPVGYDVVCGLRRLNVKTS